MKTPRELFIEKYRHREPDLHDMATRLSRQWGNSFDAETVEKESLLRALPAIFCWRNYWFGLGATWIVIGLLHAATVYQAASPNPNHSVEWSGDLDLILFHYAATDPDELGWMDDLHSVPAPPVDHQLPRSDKAPGPQGGLHRPLRKGGAPSRDPIPAEERNRHLECGGSPPLWIRQGNPTTPSSVCTVPLFKISNFNRASSQTGWVRVGHLVLSGVLGVADRIQSGGEPPHSREHLPFRSDFGVC